MRSSINYTMLNTTGDTGTFFSENIELEFIDKYAIRHVITDATTGADAFLAGEVAIETLNFDTKANTGDGDYVVVHDTTGQAWAVAADLTGASAEPTGATWVAISAAFKAQADISGDTTDIDVAASFETAFDGISGFTAVIVSDDTAADGTMLMTNVVRGPVTASIVKDENDAGAGSITAASTNVGIASTVNVTSDSITSIAHGMVTGAKGQFTTTGTLPAGLSLATDFFVILIDANTYQVASSLVNAEAGTQVDITDQGTDGGTHTFTPIALSGTLTYQQSVDSDSDTAVFADLASPAPDAFTGAETKTVFQSNIQYRYIRLKFVVTDGTAAVTAVINGKG